MESLDNIKYMLYSELDEIARKGDISLGELESIHKLTDTIKNIHKIEMYEGYSYRDNDYSNRNNSNNSSYNYNSNGYNSNNYSYRSPHWVRGHYSRAEDMEHDILEAMKSSNLNSSDKDILIKAMEVIRR